MIKHSRDRLMIKQNIMRRKMLFKYMEKFYKNNIKEYKHIS